MSETTQITVPTTTALAPVPPRMAMGKTGVQLQSLEEAFRFAKAVATSGFAPKGMEKPESILIAIQLGMELGLTPMAALQNIGVINGRPGIYGDAALALVRASGLCQSYVQKTEGTGDKLTVIVTSKRVDSEPLESRFSVADAKLAGLWGKSGPWSQYPERMLLFRARGFNLRDNFGDVLKGLKTTEELGHIAADLPRNVTPSKAETVALETPINPFASDIASTEEGAQ